MTLETATVLAVDDDADILLLVDLALTAEGFVVRLATNGREGLARLAEGLPNLILLDMRMPVMSGWEFARAFRARYDHAVSIVVLSAADDAGRLAAEIGADGWVGKPFDLEHLIRVVRRHTGKAGPQAGSPSNTP